MRDEILEFTKKQVDWFNEEEGELIGYDCPKCKNKGRIAYLGDDGYIFTKQCSCMPFRKAMYLAEKSGLGNTLKEYTFEKYNHDEKWQEGIFLKAKEFLTDETAHCFYIGGQNGSGKSHICTAISGWFLEKGIDVHFCFWNDIVTELKQTVMDDTDKYDTLLEKLQTATILYIDDFFKIKPTTADMDKAFQIINYRYNLCKKTGAKRFITIISSEKTLSDLVELDEAIASRIVEMSNKKYALSVEKDTNKNMRLR